MTTDFISRIAVQTWTFRHWKENEKVIDAVKESGLSGVEMCGFHFDPAQGSQKEVLRQYQECGISVVSFGVHVFGPDEAADRKVFEFATLAGFPAISAHFPLGASIEKYDKLAAVYGKKLAIHNHGRKHHHGSIQALEAVFCTTSEHIGLCLDTAWAMDAGEDPLKMAEKFQNRLYGVHFKDFVFDKAGRPEDVVLGTGNLDLEALIRFLSQTGYDGPLTLEYEGDEKNPVPANKKCVEALRRAIEKVAAGA